MSKQNLPWRIACRNCIAPGRNGPKVTLKLIYLSPYYSTTTTTTCVAFFFLLLCFFFLPVHRKLSFLCYAILMVRTPKQNQQTINVTHGVIAFLEPREKQYKNNCHRYRIQILCWLLNTRVVRMLFYFELRQYDFKSRAWYIEKFYKGSSKSESF